IRSNQNPESALAQSIPGSGSWPPLSLGPQRIPDCCQGTKCSGFATNGFFPTRVLPDSSRKPSPQSGRGGRCIKGWAKVTCANLDGLSGILHSSGRFLGCANEPILELAGNSRIALSVCHVSRVIERSVLVSIRVVSSIVLLDVGEGFTMPYEDPAWYE